MSIEVSPADSAAQANNPLSPGNDPALPRLLLMRHAQTVTNLSGTFSGAADAEVSELGRQQSAAAVEGLVAWGPERIVTSPLSRARKMIAEPAGRALGVPVTVDARIGEFDFGPLEGKCFAYAAEQGLPLPWGPGSERWPQLVEQAGCGETMEAFIARLAAAAAELECMEGRTAVICHGGVVRGLMSVWFGLGAQAINRLVVGNVSSALLRVAPGNVCLEAFGLQPEDLARHA